MAAEVPDYYFRTRENGAFVFRVAQDGRNSRLDMDQIAVVNIRNGEIKPHGGRDLNEADMAAIETWMTERAAELHRRTLDDIRRTVDHLNQVTHWIQSKADPDDIEAITDDLLLSMHDLRQLLVRKRGERLMREEDEA